MAPNGLPVSDHFICQRHPTLRQHPCTRPRILAARVSDPVVGAQTANERSRSFPFAGEVMRWLFTGNAY
jgi:hypothetical protein